jgi:transposase
VEVRSNLYLGSGVVNLGATASCTISTIWLLPAVPSSRTLRRRRTGRKDLEAVDRAIAETIEACPELRARRDILISIAGISEITAAALITLMPELGRLDRKQAASLAGLAPVTRRSGRWRGQAFIQGGRAALRQVLYMPAIVACRFNRDLKAKYAQLISAGKPQKVAITAIMRKLVILANALIRDNRPWQASRP